MPPNYSGRLKLSPKAGHEERALDLPEPDTGVFRIILRKCLLNQLDFSVILGFIPPGESQPILLRRYNGRSHQHTNKLEREATFYDFHIHTATERYQVHPAFKAEHYAEVTDRYVDFQGAFRCLSQDCGLVFPPGQANLFEG